MLANLLNDKQLERCFYGPSCRVGSVFRYAFAEFPKIQLNIICENSPQTLIGGCRQRYP